MESAEQLSQDVGVRQACETLGIPRASFYRRRQGPNQSTGDSSSRRSPRALSSQEREKVRQSLYSSRFMDQAPRQVYARLLDDGEYLCSVRTMYRILDEDKAAKERRNQLRHPNYQKPELLATLGVTKSHSRPHVSNDNPFSESQFKTMKYCPEFPDRFGGYDDALGYCRRFIPWYNDEHYHSGIGLVTPAMLHYGTAAQVVTARQSVLEAAYAAHPERFVKGLPAPPVLPTAVWINPPKTVADQAPQKQRLPEIHGPQKPDAPLTHPRPGYPSPSCVPAELDSVSPGDSQDTDKGRAQQLPLNTRAMPQKIPGGLGAGPQGTARR